MARTLAQAINEVRGGWHAVGRPGSLSDYAEKRLRGVEVELRPGTIVTVSSVMNAGFSGLSVGGYTADGKYRAGSEK